MVLTRNQEKLLEVQNTPPPPSKRPATLPDGTLVKSALKTRPMQRYDSDSEEEATTPKNASVRKRVRIHSGNNIVHVFQTSTDTGVPLTEDVVDDARSAQSWSRRRRVIRRSKEIPFLVSALAAITWMLTSTLLIFQNKLIMVDKGFPFPLALVALTQIGSAAFGWMLRPLNLARVRPMPPLDITLVWLLPIAVCSAGCLFLGNYAYLGLSVAFLNILKALAPVATLIVGFVFGLEHPSTLTLLSTLLMAWGSGIATAQESATTHFSWIAFAALMLSVIFEAFRVVLTEKLISHMHYTPMEVNAHVSPLTFGILAVGAQMFERKGLDRWASTAHITLMPSSNDFILVIGLSFAVNIITFYAIKTTSSTTFKVVGCMRNVSVVAMGMFLGDELSARELQGFAISILGFLMYTYARAAKIKSF